MPAVEIDRGPGRRPEVSLTFDAGADWRPAKQILDTLREHGVRSTFFLTGEWVEGNPKTARRIAAEGHEIGNHSWDHPAFTHLADEQIRDQLRRTESLVQSTTGRTTHPYFRPPLGARDRRVLQTVADEGFLTIYWTLDSRDSVDRGITAAEIRDRVLQGVTPGAIVLLHCGSRATADALPEILAGLRERGLAPVPVGRLLEE
jgi:peptidoglycan/xylan/chitin deacetylase (PgdA/CDA1 family)